MDRYRLFRKDRQGRKARGVPSIGRSSTNVWEQKTGWLGPCGSRSEDKPVRVTL